MKEIHVDFDKALEIDNLISGVFYPATNFADENDYLSILSRSRLANGEIWPIPIVLPVTKDVFDNCLGRTYHIKYDGIELAEIVISNTYIADFEKEALSIFGTTELSHPGVKKLANRSPYLVAGALVKKYRFRQDLYDKYQLDPAETKKLFANKGWKTIVGFQTRNPIHRAHEYVQKSVLETVDGLFLNPLAGSQKDDDIPAHIRMKTYEAILDGYYNRNHVHLGIYPAPMYYAGPKEAVLHALVRKNYGCTHFIVGRDHAGVGKFYGPFDAQRLAASYDLGIQIISVDMTFFCNKCDSMTSNKTCPHPETDRLTISGTELRKRLGNDEEIPSEISRPEVVRILKEYYQEEENA